MRDAASPADFIRPIADKLSPDCFATSLNRQLYEQLIARQQQGAAIDPALLAVDASPDQSAYITHLVIQARDAVNTLEEAQQLAQVIQQESQLNAASDLSALSPDEMQKLLEIMRKQK